MLQLWRQTTELTSKGLKEKDAVQKEIGSDTGTTDLILLKKAAIERVA